MSDLSVTIGNTTFINPVFTASGTFGYGDEVSRLFDVNQLGAVITKSITDKLRRGSIPPRTAETTSGMLNSIGLANVGVDQFVKEKVPFYQTLLTKVIVNIAGETVNDYCAVVEKLEKVSHGICGYEVNISCPNTDRGGMYFGVDPDMSREVIARIRSMTSRLIIAKLTPNVTSNVPIAEAVREAGADAISLINSVVGMAIDVRTRRFKIGSRRGGLTGPCIKPIAIANVYEVYQNIDIPIIGIGGISNTEDALEFFLAGAAAIQVGTANFFDPLATIKIIKGLQSWMENEGVLNIGEIIGQVAI